MSSRDEWAEWAESNPHRVAGAAAKDKRGISEGDGRMIKGILLIIPGSPRTKKNHRIRTKVGKSLPPKAFTDWEKSAQWEAKIQLRNAGINGPITSKMYISAVGYYKGPKPDLSGFLEGVGDCFEGVVWENDRQIVSWDGSRLRHDKENPRTELNVRWEKGDTTDA